MATDRSLALRPTEVSEGSSSPNEHGVRFKCLLEDGPRASDVVAAWKRVLDEDMGTTVSEAVLLEAYFSCGSAIIPSLLTGGTEVPQDPPGHPRTRQHRPP